MEKQRKKQRAIIEMLLCAALWSIGGLFIKLIPWSPFAIAGFRSLLAAAVMLCYMRTKGQKLRFTQKTVRSGFFMAATLICFVTANKLTTAANAVVLQYSSPIFIMLLSALFLKKKFGVGDIVAVIVTLAGMVLFFFGQLDAGNIWGNIIGVLSGIAMASMFVCVDDGDSEQRMSGMAIGHMMTAIIGMPFLFVVPSEISGLSLCYIIILGIVQLGVPYVLYGRASENCPPLACSLLAMIEPVLNPIWVLLVTGESPGIFSLIGGAVIIVTVTVWCIRRDKNEVKV